MPLYDLGNLSRNPAYASYALPLLLCGLRIFSHDLFARYLAPQVCPAFTPPRPRVNWLELRGGGEWQLPEAQLPVQAPCVYKQVGKTGEKYYTSRYIN